MRQITATAQDRGTRYFRYAAVDFLVHRDGTPVFLEANDIALAPFFIEQKNRVAHRLLRGRSSLENPSSDHRSRLLACLGSSSPGSLPRKANQSIAIVCKRKDPPPDVRQEICFLVRLLRRHGFEAEAYTPDELEIARGRLRVRCTGQEPDLVYRRCSVYPPPGTAQPVINDLVVRPAVANKDQTHRLVTELIKEGRASFRAPESWPVSDSETLRLVLRQLLEQGKHALAKPCSSYGGRGIFHFDCSSGLDHSSSREALGSISRALEHGQRYIVQEQIDSWPFSCRDGRSRRFDLRLMIYDGRFAAIEGRRARSPISRQSRLSSLVTNIQAGGSDLVVMSGDEAPITSHSIDGCLRPGQAGFEIEGHALVVGRPLLEQLRRAAEAIVEKIDQAVATEQSQGSAQE